MNSSRARRILADLSASMQAFYEQDENTALATISEAIEEFPESNYLKTNRCSTLPTVRTILNRQRWNAGFSIITEANTNGGMRVSASASKNVRSIDLTSLQ
jgi:hypothetical protein